MSEAREARGRLLHSIGNLTLVTPTFNSSLSNSAFRIKRPELAGQSRLALNAYFQKLSDDHVWNEGAITARAGHLFTKALRVWPCPAT